MNHTDTEPHENESITQGPTVKSAMTYNWRYVFISLWLFFWQISDFLQYNVLTILIPYFDHFEMLQWKTYGEYYWRCGLKKKEYWWVFLIEGVSYYKNSYSQGHLCGGETWGNSVWNYLWLVYVFPIFMFGTKLLTIF